MTRLLLHCAFAWLNSSISSMSFSYTKLTPHCHTGFLKLWYSELGAYSYTTSIWLHSPFPTVLNQSSQDKYNNQTWRLLHLPKWNGETYWLWGISPMAFTRALKSGKTSSLKRAHRVNPIHILSHQFGGNTTLIEFPVLWWVNHRGTKHPGIMIWNSVLDPSSFLLLAISFPVFWQKSPCTQKKKKKTHDIPFNKWRERVKRERKKRLPVGNGSIL